MTSSLASRLTPRHRPTILLPRPQILTGEVLRAARRMSTGDGHRSRDRIMFGPFEVTSQVFLTTPHSFALVNLKPLREGHVLVCPRLPHRRLTDLSAREVTDLFTAVQRVQGLLARLYFRPGPSGSGGAGTGAAAAAAAEAGGGGGITGSGEDGGGGSFNIALQDGPEAGQTVPHVHVHIIPRPAGTSGGGDELYDRMAGEEGNVGGALWDRAREEEGDGPGGGRPRPGGRFDRIEDSARVARSMGEMEAEAEVFRRVLRELEGGGEEVQQEAL